MTGSTGFDFKGSRVVVVGASRGGIGSAIALAFAGLGADVTITGVEDAPIEGLGEGSGAPLDYRRLDVTDEAAVRALASEHPALDVLVNCAGISQRGLEYGLDAFRRTVDVNLAGTFATCNAFLDALSANRGRIVNTASMYAQFASPANPGYGASKAAVAQLTRSLAVAWAERGVRVNAVAPGFIVTEQSRRARADAEHYDAVIRRTPAGRWGEPADLVGPVLFLASEASAFVNGTVLVADGGYSAV